MNTNNLITWESTVEYGGQIPIARINVGNQIISQTEGEVRQTLVNTTNNAVKNNAQTAIFSLNQMISILQRLDINATQTQQSNKTDYTYSQKQMQEKNDENSLLYLWNSAQANIFGNIIPISLTAGFYGDNSSFQLGYAEDEVKYIERVNSLGNSINNDINYLLLNQDINYSNIDIQKAQKAFEQHYNGLLQSISQERSSEDRAKAYIWSWYYKRSAYQEAQRRRPNGSYGDIFIGPDKSASSIAFTAFNQHMSIYHNMALLDELDALNVTVESEEGVPNLFQTLSQASYEDTNFFSSGDMITIDDKGNIKLNTQAKLALTDKYKKSLKYKALLNSCLELKNLLINPNMSIDNTAYDKILSTVLNSGGAFLDNAIQNTINDLMSGFNLT